MSKTLENLYNDLDRKTNEIICLRNENKLLKDENEFAKEKIRAVQDRLREVETENAELRKQLEMAVKDIERRCGTCAHNHNGDCSERSGRACKFWKWRGAKESERADNIEK